MSPVDQFTPQEPILFKPADLLAPDYIAQSSETLHARISPLYSVDEERWLSELLPLAKPTDSEREAAATQTRQLVEHVRNDGKAVKMVDSLLLEYSLDTQEGILLMSLAEALIRVPDNYTADALIHDKMSVADWKKHLKNDNGFMVNASTWGMMMTGRVVSIDSNTTASGFLDRMTKKMGEPVIRSAMQKAMRIMGHQFVLGETIEGANKNSQPYRNKGYTYSFDMLGEAAITHKDAEKYFNDYLHAIKATASIKVKEGMPKPSVSIKLSALHPRYEATQEEQVMGLLRQRCLLLIEAAREVNVDISIDAEEADRLEISLKLFESLYRDNLTADWDGLGIVVQGYSKRAIAILVWLASLATEVGDRIPVRLVKGAYWDTEIKLAQQKGLSSYPVWTRKEGTDTAYLACARFLLSEHLRGLIWPQFATHNAHTLASIMTMSAHRDFEFQRLHGMGDALYDHILQAYQIPVRIYAPVGAHKDLLPYLVRRLLENGANSSFVHQLLDKSYPIDKLTVHPYDKLLTNNTLHNPDIPLPLDIYGERRASFGPNIFVESQWLPFKAAIDSHLHKTWSATSIINGKAVDEYEADGKTHQLESQKVRAPWNHEVIAGEVKYANAELAVQAIDAAVAGQSAWQAVPAANRAAILRKVADLYEENYAELMALCQIEAGKTMQDGIDEIKEAVDFCRFYADEAERLDDVVHEFTDLTGQSSRQIYKARGTFVCISPWNFPLAIYTGQIVAALAAGNTVVAKPAEQTSLIAHFGAQLMYQAGVPVEALQLVTGAGDVGGALTAADNIAGVIFTGSTQTAQRINQSLNNHVQASGELPVFIAETGGQNAMIVDSTALPEQVVKDAVLSAFGSAGQRCSACRILCVQEEVADNLIELLQGTMAELVVGNPLHVTTDVGPVIDADAKRSLEAHIERMSAEPTATILAQTPMSASSVVSEEHSTFVLPTAIEVKSIDVIGGEHFGPILHVLRYQAPDLNKLIDAINGTGFGLTLGIHSRIENIAEHIERRAFVGNTYINRNQIGAVVNVQPFGGCGLSGTGPKAGGPHYVARLMQLQSESITTESLTQTQIA
ncbi:bifunctional proline dehydrogenase/L-glutamate gamma-semialdehyde dehydrogenase PutA [Psychrobacter maritimus]|jgi:RHH-type proline utilization regulon transcriptional repressor/proline dehydrogenase/delta 1-pyrroline-5-carboxylate dehydrogenase|uniref:bifunctional proline dehydrogenase/L-glutamate gamma-semialdehyde dehydrogenase PutA n=1 Tax=Psychrobacter maritimus TaxID=256325 RepID=UPI00248B1C28|nr:bifunctional proline dehydrogenase/L-glutamate gamma-semialdehyde dehydrogenase PutA [Psychrobacter sp. WB2]WGV13885.1 bifunctional proline dehydrogenase/L-glutamate gamma-semialdehyde dehydrogenase PutA [Psychrobacter sp. WB2]